MMTGERYRVEIRPQRTRPNVRLATRKEGLMMFHESRPRTLLRPQYEAVAAPDVARSALGCENGRHSAISATKVDVGGVIHAECRHCGCQLMRFAASRRWFRCGEMG
jgi:exosome complex RNA-binding protein Csl4